MSMDRNALCVLLCTGTMVKFFLGAFYVAPVFGSPTVCFKEQARAEDPFAYMRALVESFNLAHSAVSRTSDAAKSGVTGDSLSEMIAEFGEWMFGLRLANKDYDCAAAHVKGYQASKNQAIQTSAKGATLVYLLLMKHDEEMIAHIEELIRTTQRGSVDLAKQVRQVTDLRVKIDEAWKILPAATTAGLLAMVDTKGDPDQKLQRLLITRSQRMTLLEAVHKTFGDEVKAGMKAGQSSLVASAGMVYAFVADERWMSADK